jgi:hypothetical protein
MMKTYLINLQLELDETTPLPDWERMLGLAPGETVTVLQSIELPPLQAPPGWSHAEIQALADAARSEVQRRDPT